MTNLKTITAEFVNLTPHTINMWTDDKSVTADILPSGTIARVSKKTVLVGYINGFPDKKAVYGEIENLPAPQEGVIFIVSGMIISALKDKGIQRDDLRQPGELMRDENNNPCGCIGTEFQ